MFLPNRRQFLTPLLFGALTFICLHLQFSSLGRWCLCLEPQPLKSILWSINLAWIVLRSTLILRAWFWASPKISVRLPAHTLMEMFFSQLKKNKWFRKGGWPRRNMYLLYPPSPDTKRWWQLKDGQPPWAASGVSRKQSGGKVMCEECIMGCS